MPSDVRDDALETCILDLLAKRRGGASICPSEAARAYYDASSWRDHMDDVRAAAARLQDEGRLRVTQGDDEVDPLDAAGPIRLRLP